MTTGSNNVPGTPADGHVKIVTLATAANLAQITVAELTDDDTIDLSCYFTSDGWTPSLDQQVATDDRLCDTVTYENIGRSQRSLAVKYVENPAADVGTTNLAKETLTPGSTGYFVERRGYPVATAWAAGQKYQAWPYAMGDYDEQPPEANSVLKVAQKPFVTGPRIDGVVHA